MSVVSFRIDDKKRRVLKVIASFIEWDNDEDVIYNNI